MKCCGSQIVQFLFLLAAFCRVANGAEPDPPSPALTELKLVSSLDGEHQPVLFWAPTTAAKRSTPLFVYLHSWSGNYRQKNDAWHREAVKHGWIYIHPDFRGPNRSPKACGSKFARRDILDAVDFAIRTFNVDPHRIYLAGTSGGGHMAMLMAGHHPDRFSAVSAWVGISSLADWYAFHTRDGKRGNYAQMVVDSLGGPPNQSRELDAEYRDRSPIHHLHRIGDLPLDIAAGVRDGHKGSVPIAHSLKAFNVIAQSTRSAVISETEMAELSERGRLAKPFENDPTATPKSVRRVLFRREAANSRVTIFDGGHEGLPSAACNWLNSHRRLTTASKTTLSK